MNSRQMVHGNESLQLLDVIIWTGWCFQQNDLKVQII